MTAKVLGPGLYSFNLRDDRQGFGPWIIFFQFIDFQTKFEILPSTCLHILGRKTSNYLTVVPQERSILVSQYVTAMIICIIWSYIYLICITRTLLTGGKRLRGLIQLDSQERRVEDSPAS